MNALYYLLDADQYFSLAGLDPTYPLVSPAQVGSVVPVVPSLLPICVHFCLALSSFVQRRQYIFPRAYLVCTHVGLAFENAVFLPHRVDKHRKSP